MGYDADSTHAHRIYWPEKNSVSVERNVKFTSDTITIRILPLSKSNAPAPAAIAAPPTPPAPPALPPAPAPGPSAPQRRPPVTSSGEEELEEEEDDMPPPTVLRASSRCSRSRILVSEGYHVRVSYVSVNPACHVSKWTKSRSLNVTEWNIGEVRQ